VSAASNVFSGAAARTSSRNSITVDPFRMLEKEMKFLAGNMQQLVGSGHPAWQNTTPKPRASRFGLLLFS
jgi:hexaprenyl-diphosphate synthase